MDGWGTHLNQASVINKKDDYSNKLFRVFECCTLV